MMAAQAGDNSDPKQEGAPTPLAERAVVKEYVWDTATPKKISHIKFGLLSAQDMMRVSEIHVVNRELYLPPTRDPMPNGALDKRLGVCDKVGVCETCGEKVADCAGHYGFIKLELPVFHTGYFKAIIVVLQIICKNCSRVLLEDGPKFKFLSQLRKRKDSLGRAAIFKQVRERTKKTSMCPSCGALNGVVKKVGHFHIIHEKYRSKKDDRAEFVSEFDEAIKHNRELRTHLSKAHEDLNPIRVLNLFERIPAEDVELLDMDPMLGRPERLILTHLLVPPVTIRPSVKMDAGQGSNEDYLTMKLGEIIGLNNNIRGQMEKGALASALVEDWAALQVLVAAYFNSQTPGLPAKVNTGKGSRGFAQRLKGKTGRFRGNLSGKRVDFSSRTVISPDPNLRIDQVAVPRHVAKTLTYPEKVCAHNVERLRTLVRNGPDRHPGANFIVRAATGEKTFLRYGNRAEAARQLRAGDIVERHLQDGDVVLFNRQPSLHKMSIMAHRVRVMDGRTFRFNECFAPDTRVLTNRGFLFEPQLRDAMMTEDPPLFACYDPASQTIVFRPGTLVYPTNRDGVLVAFTSHHAGPDAVSLRVTPGHDMYVQLGRATADGAVVWEQNPTQPFRKTPAVQLTPDAETCSCVPKAHPPEGPCPLRCDAIRLLAYARAGVARSPVDGAFVSSLVGGLGLSGKQQVDAFLELFGFWLGSGVLEVTHRCVVFAAISPGDITFVREKLQLLLPNGGWRLDAIESSQDNAAEVRICDPRFYEFFYSHYWQVYNPLHLFSHAAASSSLLASTVSEQPGPYSALHLQSKSTKPLPDWVLQRLNREQLRLVLAGIRRTANGPPDEPVITTASAEVREQLLAAMVLAGYSPHFTGDPRSSSAAPLWRISYTDSPAGSAMPVLYRTRDVHKEQYTGPVWCVVVQHDAHLVVAQRAFTDTQGAISAASRPVVVGQCVCTPYNADFDGDEMNLHVPQTEEARAEALTLMSVIHNLITPRSGEPLVAATQDFLTASYLLSHKDRFFDRAEFCQLCSYAYDASEPIELPPPAIVKPVQLWTGKQVFGVLVRPTRHSNVLVNFEAKSKSYTDGLHMCPRDGYVCFRNSELLCGVLDKNTLGAGGKDNLFHVLLRDFSPDVAADRMARLAKMTSRWLQNYGMSIGIADVQPSDHLTARKAAVVRDGYEECDEYIRQYRQGRLAPKPGCNVEQTLEAILNKILSEIRSKAGKICIDELPRYNSPLIMTMCGSKGSTINISQMVAVVGQQTVSGTRIPNGFVHRTLPHFDRDDKIPAAKGFVQNSFYSGLSPTEFFFHTMGGREGLVDTAVKTAETGYMQRRLMKALEDLSTQYDETVRNSAGDIVQFTYGDDGLDPANMEAAERPVDFARAMMHIKATAPCRDHPAMLPHEIVDEVDRLLRDPAHAGWSDLFKAEIAGFFKAYAAKLAGLRTSFGLPADADAPVDMLWATRAVNAIERWTRPQLQQFLRICGHKFFHANIEPGTAVGAIAAQSIGEPGTQMTLKTFHFAGVASMNITLGVPRIKEIINASKEISTPIITAALADPTNASEAVATKARIERTTLGEVCEYIKEVFRPSGCYIAIRLDMHAISSQRLGITADTVRAALLRAPRLKIKPKQVVVRNTARLRVLPADERREHMFFALQALKNALPHVQVAGLPGVSRVVVNLMGEGKYNLLVEGTGVLGVMATPGVMSSDVKSNHIIEMERALGIEAARKTIMSEIQYTMKEHGMTIDTRHVMLLADVMTYRGEILGITRFGICKMKESVLMLASFEKTTDHLFDAALHARVDEITGVSECIIMGQPVPLGTGMFKLLHKTTVKNPPQRDVLFGLHSTSQKQLDVATV